jgi:uncharacterized protein
MHASESDIEAVTRQLGHRPRGEFEVTVRDANNQPVVIKNAPLLFDGTPMPTLYWLTGPEQIKVVGQLESGGGVNQAEVEIDPELLSAAHARYASERDALLVDHVNGPKPSGGVGGTRTGVKCLHAHYAYFLAGADDPVGQWVADRIRERTHNH